MKHPKYTMGWLKAKDRHGLPRLQGLAWSALSRIHRSRAATPAVRRLIERESRRLGYEPDVILALHA